MHSPKPGGDEVSALNPTPGSPEWLNAEAAKEQKHADAIPASEKETWARFPLEKAAGLRAAAEEIERLRGYHESSGGVIHLQGERIAELEAQLSEINDTIRKVHSTGRGSVGELVQDTVETLLRYKDALAAAREDSEKSSGAQSVEHRV